MKRLCYRYQRTLASPAQVRGVGFLTGASISLRFEPAPANTGVVFVRTDRAQPVIIPACADQVTGTSRRTTLGHPPCQVELVEHVLAALAGLRIDNCRVLIDGPEPPGLDGSALGFVQALRAAGIVLLADRRPVWTVLEPVVVTQGGASLALHPTGENELKISYFLDYGDSAPICRQTHTQVITPRSFTSELAASRTFVLEAEAQELRRQGLGSRTTSADLLVFGPDGPIGNAVRHADEPARHKVLDLVGDLSLFGKDLRGHVVAYRSGHPHNVALVQALRERMAWSVKRAEPLAA